MKIVEATVGPPPPECILQNIRVVRATFEDGSEENLFTYYPDELSFTAAEFVGLTKEEGRQLRHDRDVVFVRS